MLVQCPALLDVTFEILLKTLLGGWVLDDARPCLNEFKRFIEHYLTLSLFSLPNTQYFPSYISKE